MWHDSNSLCNYSISSASEFRSNEIFVSVKISQCHKIDGITFERDYLIQFFIGEIQFGFIRIFERILSFNENIIEIKFSEFQNSCAWNLHCFPFFLQQLCMVKESSKPYINTLF